MDLKIMGFLGRLVSNNGYHQVVVLKMKRW